MKKKFVVVFMLVLFSGLVMTACNTKSSVSGNFKQNLYNLSLGSELDFSQELNLKGIEFDKVKIYSSNEAILKSTNEYRFQALSSGKVFVFAEANGKTIARTTINVKYRLGEVQNIKVDDEGLVTWDASRVVLLGGELVFADNYLVTTVNDNGQRREFETQETSFSLEKEDWYDVIIIATSNNELIDNSPSTRVYLNYGYVARPTNLRFTSNEFAQSGTLTWNRISGAEFAIYINGIKMEEGLRENKFDFDYSSYEDSVRVTIEANDVLGNKKASQTEITLKILKTSNLYYSYDGQGILNWDGDSDALSYTIKLLNLDTQESVYYNVKNDNQTFLEGVSEGNYEASIVLNGGTSEKGLFISSKESNITQIYKLQEPKLEIDFDEKKAYLEFDKDMQVKNFLIKIDDEANLYSIKEGNLIELDLAGLGVGLHNISVNAVAKNSDGEIEVDSTAITTNFIMSNTWSFDFYKLEELGEVLHFIDDEYSMFSFDRIENATDYIIYVGDTQISDIQTIIEGRRVYLKARLSDYAPQDNLYDVRVEAIAKRDGELSSLVSSRQKELIVLNPAIAKLEQNNGEFEWLVQAGFTYSYAVYKADKNYNILSQTPVLAGLTTQGKLPSVLSEGYYVVRVTTLSNDENINLNSDFYNKNNVLSANLKVTKVLESPKAQFVELNSGYKLLIYGVDNGGEYEVYVDGVKDGGIVLSEKIEGPIEYIIKNPLKEVKIHSVEVVAKGGNLFDGEVYLPSDAFILNLERLALVDEKVTCLFSNSNELLGEQIEVKEIAGAKSVEFLLNHTSIQNSGFKLDMSDKFKFGSDFLIEMRYIGDESEIENHYYISSELKAVEFARVSAPSQLKYEDGILSWANGDVLGEKLYISLTMKSNQNQEYYHRFFTNGVVSELDLQSYIDEARRDAEFDTAFRNAIAIAIEIISYQNSAGEENEEGLSDIYYIPSFVGSTSLGEKSLNIVQLEEVELKFDEENYNFNWDYEIEGTIFEIYVDGKKVYQTDEKKVNVNELNIDFLQRREVRARAIHSNHLKSDLSEPIYLKQIETPERLTIENSIVMINLSSDTSYIDRVLVNGSVANVNYIKGGNIITFDLENFETNEFNIIFKSVTGGVNTYYLDSRQINLTLINLNAVEFNSTIDGDELSWDKVASDINGNNIDPILYQISVKNNEKTYILGYRSKNNIKLDALENEIKASLSGNVELSLRAKVDGSYTLSLNEENIVGYYGQTIESTNETKKLEKVENITSRVVDSTRYATLLDNKMNATLDITFEDIWESSEVKFIFTLKGESERIFEISALGDYENYSFAKQEGNYLLTIKNNLLKLFSEEEFDFEIFVASDRLISSDKSLIKLQRFTRLGGGELSQDGTLTILDEQNASYLVEVMIENTKYERILSGEKTLSLITSDLMGGKYDDYTIKIIAFDENGLVLPSPTIFALTGHKMKGISSVTIDDNGNVNMSLYVDNYSSIVFVAKRGDEEVDFIGVESEDEPNVFYISMIDLISLFEKGQNVIGEQNISLAVKKAGSIMSDFVDISFTFARDAEVEIKRTGTFDEDYLILPVLGDDVKSLSLRIKINANFGESDQRIYYFYANDVLGYWAELADGTKGRFVKEIDSESDFIYTRAFGIKINDLLSTLEMGDVTMTISRVGLKEGLYQYSSATFDFYKLCTFLTDEDNKQISISNDILSFNWLQLDMETEREIEPSSYIVYVKDEEGILKHQITTYAPGLDLKGLDIVPGQIYYISVKALSFDERVIASDVSDKITVLKYTSPTPLEVKDGLIQMREEDFKKTEFFKDIVDYFGQENPATQYHMAVWNKTYSAPFFFSPDNFDLYNLILNFTKLDNGVITSTKYSTEIKGYLLFPDIEIEVKNSEFVGLGDRLSYIYLLQVYSERKLKTSSTQEAVVIRNMIDRLVSTCRGIGDNTLLFDDKGRAIPAGEYSLSMAQKANESNLTSLNSESIKIFLATAPELTLEGNGDYYAQINPVMTRLYTGETFETISALTYKLQLRNANDEVGIYSNSVIELLAQYDSVNGKWYLLYGDNELDVIENVAMPSGIDGFKINMTNLRWALSEISEGLIKTNHSYRVDIFALGGDEVVANGKSGIFYLNYLDLPSDHIHFIDGKFIVENNSTEAEQNDILVRYVLAGQSQQTTRAPFVGGRAEVKLDRAGRYSSVILSLSGSVTRSSMSVESSSYLIENIYKLSAPELSVEANNISIRCNDRNITGGIKFYLGNDVSLDLNYVGEDKGYYFESDFSQLSSLEYIAGALLDDTIKVKYPSELEASTFTAYLCGNNGQFTLEKCEKDEADYRLVFQSLNNLYPIISSDTSILNAKMLPEINYFNVENGNIKIYNDKVYDRITDRNGSEAQIVYDVKIGYYTEDNVEDGKYIFNFEEDIYLENLAEIEEYLDGKLLNEQFSYFTISVTAVSGVQVGEDDTYNFISTNGNYFSCAGLKYDDGSYVLKSLTNATQYIYQRTQKAFVQSVSSVIRNGQINFILDRESIYYADEGETLDQSTAKRISIYAEYTAGGETKFERLEGTYNFSTSTSAGEGNYLFVSFIPDDGQLNDTIKAFTVYIYAYGHDSKGNNAIISSPLVVSDIYKLPNVDEYYEIVLKDGKTAIDFTNYFSEVSILSNRDCYKINVKYISQSGEEYSIDISSTTQNKIFEIPENAISVTIQAQDGQSLTQIDPKRLFFSDSKVLEIKTTSVEELEISWDNIEKRFVWTFGNDKDDEYEYYVSLSIAGNEEREFVNDNFYCPRNRGRILSGAFKIRARLKGDYDNMLFVYSEEKAYVSDEMIEYNLFSGGNGSENNPYIIANIDDFKNMALRNTNDFYFRLNRNLDIDLSELAREEVMFDEFNAHLDGGGYSLSVTLNSVYSLKDKFVRTLIGYNKEQLTFTSASAIFYTLSSGASVSNMNIYYSLELSDIDTISIMVAPICVYNYGSIENVNIRQFDIAVNGTGTSNDIFVAGLACVNYGNISFCTNYSEFDYSMQQRLEMTFGYAGITLFNQSEGGYTGNITNCFNKGEKGITSATNNVVYLSGIALQNSGTISMCGNDGNMNLAVKNTELRVSGYYAGIAIANISGTLEYLYNNGLFTCKSSPFRGTFRYAGIAIQLRGGSISNLVETKAQPLIRNCEGAFLDGGNNYVASGSGTDPNVSSTIEITGNFTLEGRNGYKLIVTGGEDGYNARIAK